MDRRSFIRSSVLSAGAAALSSRLPAEALRGASHRVATFNLDNVRLLPGPFLDQVNTAVNVYKNLSDDSLLLGFRRRAGLAAPGVPMEGWYGKDTWNAFGQYLAGMARLRAVTGDKAFADKANFLISEWAKTIEPDGYFFYSREPNAWHYFYEKMMSAMNDAHEFLGNREALAHGERITAWGMKNLSRLRPQPSATDAGGTGGIGSNEWYTLPENLYRFYEFTGDKRYRDFAAIWHYDTYWDGCARGNPEVHLHHAYSHVNTLNSAAMTYKVRREPKYLRTLINGHAFINATQTFATGGFGPGERLQRPGEGRLGASLENVKNSFETPCGSWAVFKLSRYLIGFTGDAHYGDWMESMLYNGIGAALPVLQDGTTYYYSDYRLAGGSKGVYKDKWPCCSGTYPQVIAEYFNTIFFHDDQGLYVNLYVPSEVRWSRKPGEAPLFLRQEGTYPENPQVRFTVIQASGRSDLLRFRVPGWAEKNVVLRVNGEAANVTTVPGTWATLRRKWKTGDRIDLDIPLTVRALPIDAQHPDRIAIARGPEVLVYARKDDESLSKADLPSLFAKRDPSSGALHFPDEKLQGLFATYRSMAEDQPYRMYFDVAT